MLPQADVQKQIALLDKQLSKLRSVLEQQHSPAVRAALIGMRDGGSSNDRKATGLKEDGRPIYRAKKLVSVAGAVFNAGHEFYFISWPPVLARHDLEPVNDAARRVFAYLNMHGGQPPHASPWVNGALHLPVAGTKPSYHVRSTTKEIKMAKCMGELRFEGTSFRSTIWPDDKAEPRNAEAEEVCAYYAKYHDHPCLPASPWDDKAQRLSLPELNDVAEV